MSLITQETKLKVSSVLNKDTKSYGRQHLIDRHPESCWNSDTGLPQTILIDFGKEVEAKQLHVVFQGGFVGTTAQLHVSFKENPSTYIPINLAYFDDVNLRQTADIVLDKSSSDTNLITRLKIEFIEGSDFYGRITIYDLDVV